MITSTLPLAGIAFSGGLVAGQFIRFKRVDGRKIKPGFDSRPFQGSPWFKLAIITLFLMAFGTTIHTSATQRNCNEEFLRTIKERADVSVSESEIRSSQDEAVKDMVATIATARSQDEMFDALGRYLVRYQQLADEQKDNADERASNPYPTC